VRNVFAFDVDGTLTAPRQRINPGFENYLRQFVNCQTVFLITGSDHEKISEQLPSDILQACDGVFTCSGAEFWQQKNTIYRKTHMFPKKLIELAEHFIDSSPYPLRCGNHIEHRPGMLNISVVGRNASLEQRKAYHRWEEGSMERKAFVSNLLNEFPEYEASTGGEISIDIVPNGWTKAVARAEIEKRVPGCNIIFFGDKMSDGGNDKPLADELGKYPQHNAIAVESYEETWSHLVTHVGAMAA